MKKNSGDSGNTNLMQQFAVKSNKKKVIYNDRTVIYNRCSTVKQDSLEWQEKACTNFCNQNNLVLIKCFGEKTSATTDDREEFKEMFAFCLKENISHIVIFSYDRFSRTGDLNLLKDLKKNGIKLHAATQSVDDQTASGRFSQKMYLMFAEMENEQRREKIIEGLKNKLRKGEWIIKPPIGYYKGYKTGKKEYDLEKPQCFISDKGKILSQAFNWKVKEKLSNIEIADRLKTMGLILDPAKLTRIFRNPFYCGYITNSLLDDGEIIQGIHEPLVSEEVFLRINGILNENPHGWKRISHADKMPFKASVKCGICERPLTAYLQKEKYIYYKCPNKGCCVNVSSKRLQQLFETELSKFTIDLKLLPVIKNRMEATYRMLHQSEVTRVKPMKDELTRLKNELETMEFNMVTGKISSDLFQKHSSAHFQKIQAIEDNLGVLAQDSSNLEIYLDTALNYACNLLEMWQLLDCSGKVRLQKLIYPEGLTYIQENPTLRTTIVNPIFSAFTIISKNSEAETSQEQYPENQHLHQVYLMFSSSNFFLDNLEKINHRFKEFKSQCPNFKSTYCPSVTTLSEINEFKYTSNQTGLSEYKDKNPNASGYSLNAFTGKTTQVFYRHRI